MSALDLRADVNRTSGHVRYVPISDVATFGLAVHLEVARPPSGITSVKLVPMAAFGRVTSPPSCFGSALTMRVPRRLLVSGLKSAGTPTPSLGGVKWQPAAPSQFGVECRVGKPPVPAALPLFATGLAPQRLGPLTGGREKSTTSAQEFFSRG